MAYRISIGVILTTYKSWDDPPAAKGWGSLLLGNDDELLEEGPKTSKTRKK